MSIRKAGGTWDPMLLGIEPRNCKVCKEGLSQQDAFHRRLMKITVSDTVALAQPLFNTALGKLDVTICDLKF